MTLKRWTLDGLQLPEWDEANQKPKSKMPNCPRCGEDELGMLSAKLILCYVCGLWIGQRMGVSKALGLALVLILLSGCNTQAPTLISQLETRAQQTDSSAANRLSDLAILKYADSVKSKWGLRSMNSEILATGGKISVAALTTGTIMAGRASGATTGLAGAASLILQVLGIIDPTARQNAMGEGTTAILNAEGEYLISLAAEGINEIPTDAFSAPAATLLMQINAAQAMVEKLANGYRVNTSDAQKLEPLPVEELRQKIRDAPQFRSRAVAPAPPCPASCR